MADVSQLANPDVSGQIQNLIYVAYVGAAGGIGIMVKEFWASVFRKPADTGEYAETLRVMAKRLEETNELNRKIHATLEQAVDTNKLAMQILERQQETMRTVDIRTRNIEDHVVNLWKRRAEA